MHLHEDYGGIESSQLLDMLSNYLCSLKPPAPIASDPGLTANYQQNISDALKVLSQLAAGLDINVKFTGIRDMEFTQECIIFDVLNINLVHGWVVDPQDVAEKVIKKYSYNQLLERLVEMNTLITSQVKEENGNQDGEDFEIATKAAQLLPTMAEKERTIVEEGLAIQDFLERNSTQLTYHGIVLLHQGLKEGELCVFFRNNHFSVLHKNKGSLYLLVTDVGYQNTPVVWEKLDQINGDSILTTYKFITYQKSEPPPIEPDLANTLIQEENDFLLAQQLQEEIRKKAEQRVRSSISKSAPPGPSQHLAAPPSGKQPSGIQQSCSIW